MVALSKIEQLYRQVILDHYQNPRHRGTLAEVTTEAVAHNPSCGDVIRIQLLVVDGRILQAAFDGSGCSISQASASMLVSLLADKTVDEARIMVQRFLEVIQGHVTADDEALLADAVLLQGVVQFPARMNCAALAWKGLIQAINQVEQKEQNNE